MCKTTSCPHMQKSSDPQRKWVVTEFRSFRLQMANLLGKTISLKWGRQLTGRYFCVKTNTYRSFEQEMAEKIFAAQENEDEIPLSLNVALGQQLIPNRHLTIEFMREEQWGSKQLRGREKQFNGASSITYHLLSPAPDITNQIQEWSNSPPTASNVKMALMGSVRT